MVFNLEMKALYVPMKRQGATEKLEEEGTVLLWAVVDHGQVRHTCEAKRNGGIRTAAARGVIELGWNLQG